MLIYWRAVSEHKSTLSRFNLDLSAGTRGCGCGGYWWEDYVGRAVEDSATEAATNKKENMETANRDYLAEFHGELRNLLFHSDRLDAQKLSHRTFSNFALSFSGANQG